MISTLIMVGVGLVFIYLALKKKVEPNLLFPLGLGIVIVNVSSNSTSDLLNLFYNIGLAENELFPILLFIGIGAMIDFTPLYSNSKLALFGLVSQGGIFVVIFLALKLGFPLKDALSIGAIGTADGPTSLVVSQTLQSSYASFIGCLAYCYVAIVPLIQPVIIKLCTSEKERNIIAQNSYKEVPKWVKIVVPIMISVGVLLVSPHASSLVCMMMFGNLLSVCGLDSLSNIAKTTLVDLITLFLGLALSVKLKAETIISLQTLMILGLGLIAFICNLIFGILGVKIYNLFTKNKLNPMIGAAGISAFPMAARTVQKEGQKYNKHNHLLMQALSVNVSGQLFSAIIGGLLLNFYF